MSDRRGYLDVALSGVEHPLSPGELGIESATNTGPLSRSSTTERSSCWIRAAIPQPMEMPSESQYLFHANPNASAAGTRTICQDSSWRRPERTLRSILAIVPRSKSFTVSPVYV